MQANELASSENRSAIENYSPDFYSPNSRSKTLRTSAISTKYCTKCGQRYPATTEFFYVTHKHLKDKQRLSNWCKPCLRENNRAWRKKNPTRMKELRSNQYRADRAKVRDIIARGIKICSICKQIKPFEAFSRNKYSALGYMSACKECRKTAYKIYKQNEIAKYGRSKEALRKAAIRLEVLKYYSKSDTPNCACCGENHIQFLGIDHINGEGNKHRKSISNNLYKWLYKSGFPAGFQVLCHNCNLARGFYGRCPHEDRR